MVFNVTFINISIISRGFIGRVPGKTTDLPLVTDQLYHMMLYQVYLAMSEFGTPNCSGNRHSLYR